MQKLKISFDGFWPTFDIYDNFIVNALKKNFDVEILTGENKIYIDALFYSVWSKSYLDFNCLRICYTGENFFPDFNLCDYAIGFELGKIGDRFFRYPISIADFRFDYVRMEKKHLNTLVSPEKRKFCAQVVSNGTSVDIFRDNFFYELSKYKKVDSGGRHLNNIELTKGVTDKIDFLRNYKFSLAFENVSHPGYCTEKLVQSFAANTVPIYWGDSNVNEYFNKKSFVNLHDYENVDDAIRAIEKIDKDDELYISMLNEPAIVNDAFKLKSMEDSFAQWLYVIFSQSKDHIYRRPFYGYGMFYSEQQKNFFKYEKEHEYNEKKRNRNFFFKFIKYFKKFYRFIGVYK